MIAASRDDWAGPRGAAGDGPGLFAVMSMADGSEIDILTRIDLGSGDVTFVGPTGITDIQGLAFDACDDLYFIGTENGLGTLNKITGAATVIGGTGWEGNAQALEFDSPGNLYTARSDLLLIDPDTGDATLIGSTGVSDIRGMAAIVSCPQDLDGNGEVDFGDLLDILAHWGPCP